MKRAIKRIITTSRPLLRILDHLGSDLPRVLVYHRFAPSGSKYSDRVRADEFAWQLDTISRDFNVISLADCMKHFKVYGSWPTKAVVLTIDDGYRDFYQYAYPELLKRKIPATFFVTTRFVDGDMWLWPDRLEYAINKTKHRNITIDSAKTHFNFSLQDELEKAIAWQTFCDHCIGITDTEKHDFINLVENMLEVELPSTQPADYAASAWVEIREMSRNGIEIGSHTTNHPILSKIAPALLNLEIVESKHFIEQQIGKHIYSFCYPNSAPDDINDQVVAAVADAGFGCAVFGTDLSSWDPFRIPRMGITNDRTDFFWKIFSGESIKR